MFVPALAVAFALVVRPPSAEFKEAFRLAQVRKEKAQAVARSAEELTSLEKQLRAHLDSADPRVRLTALRGLAAVPSLGTNIMVCDKAATLIRTDPCATIRREAIQLQTDIRHEESIQPVADALADPDTSVRDAAAFWFLNHPVRPDIAVPALVKYLSDALDKPGTDADAKKSVGWGIWCLRVYGRSASEAIPTVWRAVDHPDRDIRFGTFLTLSLIARDREAMVAEFGKRFVHSDRKLYDPDRVAVLSAAPNLGPAAAVFVPDYLRFVQDDVLGNRPAGVASAAHVACGACYKLGPAAKNALPELVKLTARADEKLPLRTDLALCAIRVGATEDADLKVLAKALASKDGCEKLASELRIASDRLAQFRRHADKLCKLIAAEWDTEPPLEDDIYSQSLRLADALGADGAGLLPFLDKIAGVAGPPDGDDPLSRVQRSEYARRERLAAAGAKFIRAEIEKRKAVPKR